jgi:hypothetical protein
MNTNLMCPTRFNLDLYKTAIFTVIKMNRIDKRQGPSTCDGQATAWTTSSIIIHTFWLLILIIVVVIVTVVVGNDSHFLSMNGMSTNGFINDDALSRISHCNTQVRFTDSNPIGKWFQRLANDWSWPQPIHLSSPCLDDGQYQEGLHCRCCCC